MKKPLIFIFDPLLPAFHFYIWNIKIYIGFFSLFLFFLPAENMIWMAQNLKAGQECGILSTMGTMVISQDKSVGFVNASVESFQSENYFEHSSK